MTTYCERCEQEANEMCALHDPKWTVSAGRVLNFQGEPFVHIGRESALPVVADKLTRRIAKLLNEADGDFDAALAALDKWPAFRRTSRLQRLPVFESRVKPLTDAGQRALTDSEFRARIVRNIAEEVEP